MVCMGGRFTIFCVCHSVMDTQNLKAFQKIFGACSHPPRQSQSPNIESQLKMLTVGAPSLLYNQDTGTRHRHYQSYSLFLDFG